ncbi:hypothetical protein CLCR_09279 [Cladophialophora carrionii]|uniref:Uncharacterized protein n=1 Tax=Cladophialophora carrionii TaxID=86049 RepID=A0A1C1CRB2_9EURO|nr:hypothetical protein CLCR_09279 [Cladophialophora carrionii]
MSRKLLILMNRHASSSPLHLPRNRHLLGRMDLAFQEENPWAVADGSSAMKMRHRRSLQAEQITMPDGDDEEEYEPNYVAESGSGSHSDQDLDGEHAWDFIFSRQESGPEPRPGRDQAVVLRKEG